MPCPLTRPYGGIPPGGGFQAWTEFEIGAQRTAEAIHCILGCLSRYVARGSRPDLEIDHVREELGLVRRFADEYARPVYRRRMIPAEVVVDVRGDRVAGVLDCIQGSLASIRDAAPRLAELAACMEIGLDPSREAAVTRLASACYASLRALAQAMQRSVARHPETVGNPFDDPGLVVALDMLATAVEGFVEFASMNADSPHPAP